MNTKNTIIAFTTCTVFVLLSPFTVKVNAQNAETQLQNRVNQYIENRCERVSLNIDNRIESYNANKERHVNRYNQIKDRVTETVSKLEAQGLDVSKLKTDLQTLNQMTLEFGSTYTSFVNKLEGAKTFACGNSEGQFRNAVEEARQDLLKSRDMASDIIVFIRTTIKSDLQDIRNQINK